MQLVALKRLSSGHYTKTWLNAIYINVQINEINVGQRMIIYRQGQITNQPLIQTIEGPALGLLYFICQSYIIHIVAPGVLMNVWSCEHYD